MFSTSIALCAFLLASPPIQAEAMPARGGKKVLLNYAAAELQEVVKSISALTGKNFILEDQVRTRRITIISATKVSVDQAYQAFLAALETEGLKVEPAAGAFIKISGPAYRGRHYTPPADCPNLDAIKQKDDTTWTLPKATLDALVANPACMTSSTRIIPTFKDGKSEGFKFYGIRRDSLFSKLGLKNGDAVLRLNGQDISSPDRALEVYTQMKGLKRHTIELLRRGEKRTQTILVTK